EGARHRVVGGQVDPAVRVEVGGLLDHHARQRVVLTAGERPDGAGVGGGLQVGVAVGVLAAAGDVEAPGPHGPGVGDHALRHGGRCGLGGVGADPSTGDPGDVAEGQGDQLFGPFVLDGNVPQCDTGRLARRLLV